MDKTLEDLALMLNEVDEKTIGDHERLHRFGDVIEEIQNAAPYPDPPEPLKLLYTTLENEARRHMGRCFLDLADYYGVDLGSL